MNRVLIAEDEVRIASFVEKGLPASGYTVMIARTGSEAIALAHSEDFDLLILDLGLPGRNGWQVLEELRGRIILTAQDDVDDTVKALENGANDYVTKPFEFVELLARVRVQLRESVSTKTTAPQTTLTAGDLVLDLLTRQAWVEGQQVEMSTKEFQMAEVFLRHPMQVMSREQLLNRVWGYDYDPGSNIVDAYVKNLRKKLGSDRIETVRGMGYRFSP
ncbi:MAG: response regulator transcription factor [Aphanocapsa sp. GSE-SYN-MK-11-07L]|jgi:DNA-binding response OmpR family regulator|nr:response regulator transcription factor [Aphanocapsa sp. GSE-SYN-MK-11-07L]